jgi:excisionase family DNA binding protein
VAGDELLTIPKAAKRLNVSHMTIRRYIEHGLLHPTKPGRDYLIPAEQLDGLKRPKPGPKPRHAPPAPSEEDRPAG